MERRDIQSGKTENPTRHTGINLLSIYSSSRTEGSVTRWLTDKLVLELQNKLGILTLNSRDLAVRQLPFIDNAWVEANFTKQDQRTDEQAAKLSQSDELVHELDAADVILIGVPLYNFSIPAALKAWIDLVARAGLTFRYTDQGSQGLLKNKKVFLVVASGGVQIGSKTDYATSYLRHVLGFMGITDVTVISAERLNVDNIASRKNAERQIVSAVSEFSWPASNAA